MNLIETPMNPAEEAARRAVAQMLECVDGRRSFVFEAGAGAGKTHSLVEALLHLMPFCWSLIAPFQPALREALGSVPKWADRLAEVGGIRDRGVDYNLGYPVVDGAKVMLGHNDVLVFAAKFMEKPKFRRLMANRFPVILIDEYQDTDCDLAQSLLAYFVEAGTGPLVGFFGDHWQRIYERTCGRVEAPSLRPLPAG